jgi:hypothetical protein
MLNTYSFRFAEYDRASSQAQLRALLQRGAQRNSCAGIAISALQESTPTWVA